MPFLLPHKKETTNEQLSGCPIIGGLFINHLQDCLFESPIYVESFLDNRPGSCNERLRIAVNSLA